MYRTFVNIVPTPFVKSVVMVENKPFHCQMLHHGECSCWIGHLYNQNKENQELYHRIQTEMHEVEFSVAQMKEFRNLKEFAAVYQPWPVELSVSLAFVICSAFTFQLFIHIITFFSFLFSLKRMKSHLIILCWPLIAST